LDADLEVTVLNQPYAGSVKVGLYCDFCKQVVNEMPAEAKNGVFKLKITLSGHTGPFRLEFSTPDGNTASVSLQSTRVEERQEITVGNLGEIVNVALIPIPDGNSIRGVNWATRGISTAPVVLKNAESKSIELQVTRSLDFVSIYTFNPVTKKIRQIFNGSTKEGSKFSLENSAPYSIVVVGCIIDANEGSLFEGRAIVFHPEELTLEISAPDKVEPSEEVAITVETNRRAQCLLMVFDERLDTESIVGKLGKDIYSQLGTLGRIEELAEQFVERRVQPEALREEAVRPSVARMMVGAGAPLAKRAMAMPSPPPMAAAKMAAVPSSYAALDAGSLAAVVTASVPVQAVAVPKREWFPKLLTCKLIEVDGVHEEHVKLGDTITKWKAQVYAFAGLDYISKSVDIEADKSIAVDVDVPSMMDEGDEYYGKAVYHVAEGKGNLRVRLSDGSFYEGEVEGNGFREFKLPAPGTVEAELASSLGSDSVIKRVDPQLCEKVTTSTVLLLENGEELDVDVGKKVFVYGSVKSLVSSSVKALIQYPFGCAEQTSAKLCGLAIAWEFGENTNEVRQMIDAGLSRMTKFLQQDGLYSLWENSKDGSPDVTRKVLKNLAPVVGIDKFKEKVSPLVEKPVQELLKRKVVDNALIPLSEKFQAPISTVEDASNIVAYGRGKNGKRREALEFIESRAVEGSSGSEVHWEPSQGTWGGALESTAMSLRALYTSSEENHRTLFKKGLRFLAKRLIVGRLYSTADTRALIELFASMKDMDTRPKFIYHTYAKKDPTTRITRTEKDYDIDSKVDTAVGIDDEAESDLTVKGRKLVAHSRLFVRVDGTEIIDYRKMKSNFNFDAKLEKTTLNLGERVKLVLTPKEQSLCPITKIFLPANTAFLEGGVNIQTVSKPVVGGNVTVDIVATSRGKCKLYAVLYDMYDSGMIGVGLPIKVSVQ
jgi:hypothetical protein